MLLKIGQVADAKIKTPLAKPTPYRIEKEESQGFHEPPQEGSVSKHQEGVAQGSHSGQEYSQAAHQEEASDRIEA